MSNKRARDSKRLRRFVAIIGEAALSADDRRRLAFADAFEQRFIHQAGANRTLEETLAAAWELLSEMPASELKRIPREFIEQDRVKQN